MRVKGKGWEPSLLPVDQPGLESLSKSNSAVAHRPSAAATVQPGVSGGSDGGGGGGREGGRNAA